MHDIVEFLHRHEPFDDLAEDTLEAVARSVEVEFFGAGATIFRQREKPLKHVWIVRSGAIELVDRGQVLDALGEGELFGHPSMLSGLPTGFEARAGEDSLCYRLPTESVVPLLARPTGLRYVARSLLSRRGYNAAAVVGLDHPRLPVARLVRDRPIVCEPRDTIRETAGRMAEAGAGAALVRLPDGGLGIVTDSDLRDRVVAGSVGADAPVTKVMSAPAFTVSPQRLGDEVILEMLDRDIHHVPVVWPHGEVLGVLSDRDLLVAETRTPFSLRRVIDDAKDVDQLRRASSRLRPAVVSLHDAQVTPSQIAAIIAVVADALIRRLVELMVGELGAPPSPVAWLALGSLGRREVVLSSDLDSALVWDGEEGEREQEQYMGALGRRVVDELAACGFAADPHGATAAEQLFNRSFTAWRGLIRNLVENPEQDKALVFLSMLFDGRVVHEIGDTRDPLEELRQVWHRRTLLRLMLRFALSHQPPTGFRRFRDPPRDLVVEHSGKHQGRLDIKQAGLMPVVSLARYVSLAAGVRALSTRERLDSAATAGKLSGKDARRLNEAHDLFWQLRLDHQVEQLRQGREPDDFIRVEALDPSTRRHLRDAFRAVSAVQRSLKRELAHSL
jgi:CBS domain-containing protein